jgi:hypothetical protein
MKRAALFVITFLLLLSFPLQAQTKRLSREAIDSIRNIKVPENGESILAFAVNVVDFGTIYESDSARTFSFQFRNSLNERVVLSNVSANCGCIYSRCEKYEYEPGEKGTLYVKFNPKGRSGTVDKNIFVYAMTADDFHSDINGVRKSPTLVAKLTLLGNVVDKNEWRHLPVAMGSLRLKRKSVVFEPVRPGTSPQMRIMCANVGTSPLRLYSRLLPEFMTFATEPAELAPGEEGDIVITVDGNKLPKNGNDKYSILIEGVEGRVSDRTIEIKIENNKE